MTVRPPELPGLSFAATIGSGGYADVFAFDQRVPRRRVAVKVIRDAVGAGPAASAFLAEADAAARLEHRHIVPVFSAGLAPDGRPYLVMPYYPPPNLGERARGRGLPVVEVLRIGIQIGGAAETAHRHGLLHRDIKPANILLDRYGSPGLSDFGLAACPAGVDAEGVGVSVPWSAPEVLFGTGAPSVRSDVYSLAASLWTLLAGRAPFELEGRHNAAVPTLRRIRSAPPRPTGRAEVPVALEEVLAGALAKDPGRRPASALALVHGLQSVQRVLGLAVTEPVVADRSAPRPARVGMSAPASLTRASELLGRRGSACPR